MTCRSSFKLSRIPSHAEYASVASPLHRGCPELAPTDASMCGIEENPGFGRGFCFMVEIRLETPPHYYHERILCAISLCKMGSLNKKSSMSGTAGRIITHGGVCDCNPTCNIVGLLSERCCEVMSAGWDWKTGDYVPGKSLMEAMRCSASGKLAGDRTRLTRKPYVRR